MTIVHNVNLDAAIMKEEIFGPVLPIIPVNNVDDAVECKCKIKRKN